MKFLLASTSYLEIPKISIHADTVPSLEAGFIKLVGLYGRIDHSYLILLLVAMYFSWMDNENLSLRYIQR